MRTLEDDITFERVRHLPRRTRVCSVHRQLSWACHKEVQLYAKESHVNTYSLQRSKTAMQGRYRELQKIRKSMAVDKPTISPETARRASWPNTNTGLGSSLKDSIKQSPTEGDTFQTSTEVDGALKPMTPSGEKQAPPTKLPRSTSLFCDTNKRKITTEDTDTDHVIVPSSVLERRKTAPAI